MGLLENPCCCLFPPYLEVFFLAQVLGNLDLLGLFCQELGLPCLGLNAEALVSSCLDLLALSCLALDPPYLDAHFLAQNP